MMQVESKIERLTGKHAANKQNLFLTADFGFFFSLRGVRFGGGVGISFLQEGLGVFVLPLK